MTLRTEPYLEQRKRWPTSGRHILAQFDSDTVRRAGFDEILAHAVHSSYLPEVYPSSENWKARLAESPVRLQWDPDHDPRGGKESRRAIQLGLGGEVLHRYAQVWIVSIEGLSEFVAAERANIGSDRLANLVTPREEVYPVSDPEVATRLGIDRWPGSA